MVGFYTGDLGSLGVEEQGSDAIPAPASGVLGAAFGSAFARNPTPRLLPALGEATEQFGALDDYGRPVPSLGQPATVAPTTMMAPADAKARYGIEGVLTFDKPISESVASALYEEKHAEIVRQDTIARRTPGIMTGGFARTATALAAGLLDPINLAAGLVPGFGEARIGAALGLDLAGSLGARVGARAIAGVSGGAAGMAALEPLNYLLDQREHNDWTMGEAMRDVAFGAALGGILHVGLGGAFGRVPTNPVERRMAAAGAETNAAALRGAVAHVVDDRPVEVAPVFEATAVPRETTQAPASPEDPYLAELAGRNKRQVTADVLRIEQEQIKREAMLSDPTKLAEYAADKGISEQEMRSQMTSNFQDNVARLEAYRRHLAGMPEDVVARPLAWTELQAEQAEPPTQAQAPIPDWIRANAEEAVRTAQKLGLTERIGELANAGRTAREISEAIGGRLTVDEVRAVRDSLNIAPAGPLEAFGVRLPEDARAAAFDEMRENAARPPEHPADATAAKANAEAVERAPKVEGPVDEELAEMTKLKQEAMMAVQAEEAAGRLSADDLAALRAADEETATAEARARAYKAAANCLASRIA